MKLLRDGAMKRIIYFVPVLLITALLSFVAATDWKVKQPYEVKFSAGKIHGEMKSLKASIHFDKDNPGDSRMSATVDAGSLDAGFFIKSNHAKKAIDAEHYPNITFVSTEIKKAQSGYEALGKLTLKGVTRPTTIHFTFEEKGNEGVFKGSFKVVTKEFNITRFGSPDELAITLVVPVTK